MKRKAVISTSIAEIGYDRATKRMEVKFTTGAVYSYEDVPRHMHTDFVNADSHGSFFYRYIRSNYRTTLVTPIPPAPTMEEQKPVLVIQLKESVKKPRRKTQTQKSA